MGQEFATWLYWQSETKQGKLKLDGIEEFELWFESPISITADYGEATVVTLKGGTPLESPEARQGFREGKKVEKARLRVNYRNQTYTFGLTASTLAISALKVPVPQNASPADYLFIRLEVFEEFEAFFRSVFDAYLRLRLADQQWEKERGRMREWIREFELA